MGMMKGGNSVCHSHEVLTGSNTAINALDGRGLLEEHGAAASFCLVPAQRVNVNSRQRGEGGFAFSGFALQI
jgi:hypothetical protein